MSHPYDMGDKKKVSVLGPTLKFKGELSASEDLLIQGQVEGSITHTAKLTIGPEGVLNANVRADHIAVEGTVTGDLVATSSVVVTETSEIHGNIYSPTVTLREGSKFNGKIDMSGKEQPISESPRKTETKDEPRAARPRSGERNESADNKQAISAA